MHIFVFCYILITFGLDLSWVIVYYLLFTDLLFAFFTFLTLRLRMFVTTQ